MLPTVWSRGAVTIADHRRDRTVEAIARRLLAAAPDRFALVGLSMGGYVALEVMRPAPGRVAALALISTSARPDSPEQLASRREQQRAVAAGRSSELVEQVFAVLVDPGNIGRADLADRWRTTAREVGPEAYLSRLEATMTRPDSPPAVETSHAIMGSHLTLVPDAGHMIAQEQPEALAIAVGELGSVIAGAIDPVVLAPPKSLAEVV